MLFPTQNNSSCYFLMFKSTWCFSTKTFFNVIFIVPLSLLVSHSIVSRWIFLGMNFSCHTPCIDLSLQHTSGLFCVSYFYSRSNDSMALKFKYFQSAVSMTLLWHAFLISLCINSLIMVTACVHGSHTDRFPTQSERARAYRAFNHDHAVALQRHCPVREAGVTAWETDCSHEEQFYSAVVR